VSEQARDMLGSAIADIVAEVIREEVRAAVREAVPRLAPAPQLRPVDPNELLRVEDVAALVKVTKATVRGWVRSGSLPATLLGAGKRREYRISRASLQAFLAPGSDHSAPVDLDAEADKIVSLDRARRKG
jgi:excisionase family DNA binding protein